MTYLYISPSTFYIYFKYEYSIKALFLFSSLFLNNVIFDESCIPGILLYGTRYTVYSLSIRVAGRWTGINRCTLLSAAAAAAAVDIYIICRVGCGFSRYISQGTPTSTYLRSLLGSIKHAC